MSPSTRLLRRRRQRVGLDQQLAEHANWEYLPVEEAAAAAGWRLEDDLSTLDRVRARLSWRSLWPL